MIWATRHVWGWKARRTLREWVLTVALALFFAWVIVEGWGQRETLLWNLYDAVFR